MKRLNPIPALLALLGVLPAGCRHHPRVVDAISGNGVIEPAQVPEESEGPQSTDPGLLGSHEVTGGKSKIIVPVPLED